MSSNSFSLLDPEFQNSKSPSLSQSPPLVDSTRKQIVKTRTPQMICSYCKDDNHTKFVCPRAPFCRWCGKKGHSEDSCYHYQKFEFPFCRWCGSDDKHNFNTCSNKPCRVCLERGHTTTECPQQQWCDGCRRRGHTDSTCTKPKKREDMTTWERMHQGATMADYLSDMLVQL